MRYYWEQEGSMFHLVGDNVPLLPFEIIRRRESGDGQVWDVRCKACGQEVVLDMADPKVGAGSEHKCSRGETWYLHFGPSRSGVDLLQAVEHAPAPSEEFHRRHPPSAN